jgi:hypothetical protein
MYLKYKYMESPEMPRYIDRRRGLDSFDEIDCWTFFKCRKTDISRFYAVLRFPDRCVLDNGINMSGEEVFCRGMYELVSGEDQHNIAKNVFGRDQSAQSRAFTFFIDHIYETHLYLLTDNLEWWFNNGYVDESREAIQKKMEALGFLFDDDHNMVGILIDCNCLQTSRVAGGPRGDGEAADRWDCNIQRAFYNGWKSIHGLKHQTCDLAHGFTIFLYGPTSLRRNDLTLLRQSRINDRLAEVQLGLERQTKMFGDSIYPFLSHLFTYWNDAPNEEQRLFNGIIKSIRIAIEWNYGNTSNLFHYLRNLDKLRVMRSRVIVRIFTVCVLLRNCHIALYGCQSSNYFDLAMKPNMLERMMNFSQDDEEDV